MGLLGAGQQGRPLRPARSGTMVESLAAAFGEANPAQVTDTPRLVGVVPASAEPIHGKPLTVANGWIDRPSQVAGMSVLYIDQIQQQPNPAVQTVVSSAINHSSYAPYHHVRNGWWMYSKWDPIFRFANTAMDMRFQVGKIARMSNAQMGNIPGGVTMGPFASPYRSAYQVPRFSTEPSIITPRSAPGSR
jgi:hypothetical protein